MVLASLAMGLTLGTKQIPVFVAPGMLVMVLIVWLKDRKNHLKPILTWAAASIIFTLLLGSYIYIQNTIVFHNPLGDEITLNDQISGNKGGSVTDNLVYNSARDFYQSIDFTGLPNVYIDNLIALKARLFKPVFTFLGLDLESATAVHKDTVLFSYLDNPEIQEDKTWYGPLSFLLLVPTVIIQLVQGFRRHDPIRLGLIFMFVSFFLIETAVRPGWEPFQGRYFILALVLVAPFIASFYQPELRWRILNWLSVFLAAVIVFSVMASNSGKPLLSYNRLQTMAKPYTSQLSTKEQKKINALIRISFPNAKDIWDLDRTGRQLLQGGGMGGAMILVNQYVPEDATLALGFTQNMFTFPFFGEHLTRRLIPVYPPGRLQDEQWFKENGIQYMILYLNDPLLKNKPSWLVQYQRYGNWGLYYPAWNPPPEIK
jgi:hypothetical protein